MTTFRFEAGPPPRSIEMVWECPKCGLQLAHMTGYEPVLPTCEDGHTPTEMEQRSATRWAIPSDNAD